MSVLPTRIDAPFLADPRFRSVMAAIEVAGDRARVVGGAVRNTLIGREVSDVDIATTARPDAVIARAEAAGLKAIPTGIEHGTVTVIADGHPFEVTTLRADVETDGRRAVVAFTDNWAADAARRDFTMNAIYADADGTLFDPAGGIADALAGRVRFVGSPEARIGEDYLRVLRFFRFHAQYGTGDPDAEAIEACDRLQAGLDILSRERIGQEIRKLVIAPRAAETVMVMAEMGILAHALGADGYPDRFVRLAGFGRIVAVPLALAVLGADAAEDADRLQERLRLANTERDAVADMVTWAGRLGPSPAEVEVKRAVYRAGNETVSAALIFAAARSGAPLSPLVELADTWQAPRFPISGRDLLAAGMQPGPEVGRRLAALEEAWIAGGFGPVDGLR